MDKKIIFAVAGAGKTTSIINRLTLDKRAIIITYTENNYFHLRNRIIQKFGYLPNNIVVQTYFTFLYSFCYRPFFHHTYGAKGINWELPPSYTRMLKRTDLRFYLDDYKRLYSNRIAKLVTNNTGISDIINRLEKYFDELYIDEIQDLAGHDFNLLKEICNASINILLVGDFYQHTFDTSRDGSTNANLYNDFQKYKKIFVNIGVSIDTSTLTRSYRCPPSVCNFINENLNINIESGLITSHLVNFESNKEKVANIFYDEDIVKLFFKEHHKYRCYSNNWGKSKGLDNYSDVCVVLNPTTLKGYKKNDFSDLPPSSRNKLYVACTRTKKNLYFISESELKNFKKK